LTTAEEKKNEEGRSIDRENVDEREIKRRNKQQKNRI
jgi:hypothetical protein